MTFILRYMDRNRRITRQRSNAESIEVADYKYNLIMQMELSDFRIKLPEIMPDDVGIIVEDLDSWLDHSNDNNGDSYYGDYDGDNDDNNDDNNDDDDNHDNNQESVINTQIGDTETNNDMVQADPVMSDSESIEFFDKIEKETISPDEATTVYMPDPETENGPDVPGAGLVQFPKGSSKMLLGPESLCRFCGEAKKDHDTNGNGRYNSDHAFIPPPPPPSPPIADENFSVPGVPKDPRVVYDIPSPGQLNTLPSKPKISSGFMADEAKPHALYDEHLRDLYDFYIEQRGADVPGFIRALAQRGFKSSQIRTLAQKFGIDPSRVTGILGAEAREYIDSPSDYFTLTGDIAGFVKRMAKLGYSKTDMMRLARVYAVSEWKIEYWLEKMGMNRSNVAGREANQWLEKKKNARESVAVSEHDFSRLWDSSSPAWRESFASTELCSYQWREMETSQRENIVNKFNETEGGHKLQNGIEVTEFFVAEWWDGMKKGEKLAECDCNHLSVQLSEFAYTDLSKEQKSTLTKSWIAMGVEFKIPFTKLLEKKFDELRPCTRERFHTIGIERKMWNGLRVIEYRKRLNEMMSPSEWDNSRVSNRANHLVGIGVPQEYVPIIAKTPWATISSEAPAITSVLAERIIRERKSTISRLLENNWNKLPRTARERFGRIKITEKTWKALQSRERSHNRLNGFGGINTNVAKAFKIEGDKIAGIMSVPTEARAGESGFAVPPKKDVNAAFPIPGTGKLKKIGKEGGAGSGNHGHMPWMKESDMIPAKSSISKSDIAVRRNGILDQASGKRQTHERIPNEEVYYSLSNRGHRSPKDFEAFVRKIEPNIRTLGDDFMVKDRATMKRIQAYLKQKRVAHYWGIHPTRLLHRYEAKGNQKISGERYAGEYGPGKSLGYMISPKGKTTMSELLKAVREVEPSARTADGKRIELGDKSKSLRVGYHLDMHHSLDYWIFESISYGLKTENVDAGWASGRIEMATTERRHHMSNNSKKKNKIFLGREFDEDEHPRGGDSEHPGRFSSKKGDSSSSSDDDDAGTDDDSGNINKHRKEVQKLVDSVEKHKIGFRHDGTAYYLIGDTYGFLQDNEGWVRNNFSWDKEKKQWEKKFVSRDDYDPVSEVTEIIRKKLEAGKEQARNAPADTVLGKRKSLVDSVGASEIKKYRWDQGETNDDMFGAVAKKVYDNLRWDYGHDETIIKTKIKETLIENHPDVKSPYKNVKPTTGSDYGSYLDEEEAGDRGISVDQLHREQMKETLDVMRSEMSGELG